MVKPLDGVVNNYIQVMCDYCGTLYDIKIGSAKRTKQSLNKKDACTDCLPRKRKETNLLKYGKENSMHIEKFKNKLKKTNLEKYGVDNPSKNPKIINKIKNTFLNNYGVDNPMKVEHIKDKCIKRARKTMEENNSVSTSQQQIYLSNLFNAELNYRVDKLFLDMVIPNTNIYIEYDGGGHDLSVKIGRHTESEFKRIEQKRFHWLRSLGWKCFRIISPRDYLPSDKVLLKELENAKDKFRDGNSLYTITIPNKSYSEVYGKLRKINTSI